MPEDEKAGERVGRGDSSVWEVLWAVQATGPQRAGCTGLHWAERPGPYKTWEFSAYGRCLKPSQRGQRWK